MEAVREITVEETGSELEYNSFQEVDDLRREMRAEVLARQLEDETSSGCCSLSCSCYKCVKVVFLTTVIALIWAAMAVPSIVYIKEVVFQTGKGSSSIPSAPSTCIREREEYNGTICRPYLASLQSCIDGDNMNMTDNDNMNMSDVGSNMTDGIVANGNPIYIAPQEDQAKQEETISKLLNGLEFVRSYLRVSEDCIKQIKPFACLYLFPLISCDNDTRNGTVYRPSADQCMLLRDDTCHNLWLLASSQYRDSLPDCSKEDKDPPLDLLKDCQADESPTSDVPEDQSQLTCTRNFEPINGTCVPVCQQWSPFDPIVVQVTNIVILITASFAVVAGIAVLVVSCIRCNRIFTFPAIFVIYQTITLMLLAVLALVGFTARRRLFCSHQDVLKSILDPTHFCIATGILFYYLILQLLIWWLWHTAAVFHGTLFPFHMKRFKDSKRRLKLVHAIAVILGLVLPAGPVVGVGLIGKGFTISRLPTILCTGFNRNANFGFMVVPISLALAIGSTMIVFILWTVIKRHVQAHKNRLRVDLNWTAEAKVVFILLYYIALGAVVLSIFTNSLVNLDRFYTRAIDYFQCEAHGINSTDYEKVANDTCEEKRKKLNDFMSAISTTIAFVILGLYPLVNLVYTVNVKDIRKKFVLKERKVEVIIHRSRSHHSTMTRASPINYRGGRGGGRGGGDGTQQAGLIIFNAAAAANFSPAAGPNFVTSSFTSGAYVRPGTFNPEPVTEQ